MAGAGDSSEDIDMSVADQNWYFDDEARQMKYDYFDENNNDIGKTSLGTKVITFF